MNEHAIKASIARVLRGHSGQNRWKMRRLTFGSHLAHKSAFR